MCRAGLFAVATELWVERTGGTSTSLRRPKQTALWNLELLSVRTKIPQLPHSQGIALFLSLSLSLRFKYFFPMRFERILQPTLFCCTSNKYCFICSIGQPLTIIGQWKDSIGKTLWGKGVNDISSVKLPLHLLDRTSLILTKQLSGHRDGDGGALLTAFFQRFSQGREIFWKKWRDKKF